ncbi:MAG: ketopantoate reductase family protein [Pseudomonadales bacterium]
MTHTQKTWHILGAGAIGCLWAIRLQTAGVPVRLILSERKVCSLKGSTALELEFRRATTHSAAEKISLPIAQTSEHPQNVLLATKANDALGALQSRRASLSDCRNIVTLCNGMGYHADIQELLPTASIFAISTTDGAYFQGENSLVMAGKGMNKISRLVCDSNEHRNTLESIARQLSSRGHRLQTRINSARMLMDKLLINACINGLTAIHDCQNGGLLANGVIRAELNQLIDECQAVATASGFQSLASPLPERVKNVVKVTQNNYSSTYMDIKLGRKTEIDYINAYLCKAADQLNVPAPINTKIVSTIRKLEKAAQHP